MCVEALVFDTVNVDGVDISIGTISPSPSSVVAVLDVFSVDVYDDVVGHVVVLFVVSLVDGALDCDDGPVSMLCIAMASL